ncbi:hypothetical protein SAMN05443026_3243 [Burkholderia orbicola]|uniref:phage tail tape measure protein n=1 Tax=Burkholderia orbicola TaxID=2978683 RepID=UPI00088CA77B|nr:hypothetical protein SAMN05443026_3243 [Burkholderia orbicola]
MDNALKLRVVFDMIDNMTKPLKNMLAGNKGLASSLKETRRELAEMGKTQKTVGEFRQMRTGLAATASQLNAARGRVTELAGSLRAFGPPSRQMIADFDKAKQSAARLSAEHEKQSARVKTLREQLSGAGINTRNLSQHERDLRASMASTNATISDQMRRLGELADRERRVGAARSKMQAMQGVAAGMAVGGYAAKSAGGHILGDLAGTLDEAKKMQNERARITAFGLGDHATKDAEKYVRAMNTMGVSTSDNMTLMRDALSIFADEHHAQMVMPTLSKMKFANDTLFGAEDAHANEEKFMNMLKVIELRGGTKDEATFKNEANMVQKVLTATGGRVGGDEWRNFIQTGGVAAKQMRQDAFYYQMEPLIQEMGGHGVGTGLMSAYSNVYQGKTTVRASQEMMKLGLLDKKNVEYNKIGMIKRIKPGALLGGDLFKASPLEWLEKVLLPQMAKKGITDPDKVKDTISTIFTNRTAANLFSTMYMQRDQIHKNERLNKGAYGIDDAHKLAREQIDGKEIDVLSKLRNVRTEIGESIAPMYNAALDKTRAILDRLLGSIKRHQTAAKIISSVAAAFGALLVVAGSLVIVLAGVLGPLAVLRFSMTTLGMRGGILSRVLDRSAGAFGRYTAQLWRAVAAQMAAKRVGAVSQWSTARQYVARRGASGVAVDAAKGGVNLIKGGAASAINGVAAAFGGLGRTLMLVGRLALTNPIGLVITAITVAALLIIRYWEPIKAFFSGFWQGLTEGLRPLAPLFGHVFGVLGAMFEPLKPVFNWLVDAIGNVWNWITRLLGPVDASKASLDAATNAGKGFGAWLAIIVVVAAEAAGRFVEFGANIMSGLVNGIKNGLGSVKDAITGVADSTVSWFKEKLGIHSPSRVFGELGGFVSEGAAIGMEDGQGRVARAAVALATVATTSFGMPALAADTSLVRPAVPIDRRPPLAMSPSTAANVAASGPITINIYPQPGMDAAEIGRMVRAELERHERAKQSRIGARLSD